jgi:hypothetical protein
MFLKSLESLSREFQKDKKLHGALPRYKIVYKKLEGANMNLVQGIAAWHCLKNNPGK